MNRTRQSTTDRQAIGYVRVSTTGQAVEGLSLAAQRDAIARHAAAAGLELVALHADEGISGKRADTRPGLQAAVSEACDRGAVLVVYSLSRLARSTRDTLAIAEQIERAGADLVSISEKIDTSGACGRMVFRMLAVLAEFERDTISERTRTVLHHRRRQGFKTGGAVPFGYKVDRTSGKPRLVADDAEQAVIAGMLELHDAGSSLRAIAQHLTAQGIRTRTGASWSAKVVRGIITAARERTAAS